MQNKLQELTDRLYEEGLSKGRQEADQLLAKARKEAQEIVAKAREEAEAIHAAAEKEAAETRTMVEGDLKMASTQTIAALRQQVENMVLTQAVAKPVGAALSDGKFVQGLISTVVKAFNAANPDGVGLDVILPAASQNELEQAFTNEAVKQLSKGIEVKNVKGLANGFKIGPKDGGYQLSFTADDFTNLVGEYLRPATKKILFGK
jgi:V/A-type H+-transporting ATPase subunit E